MEEIVALSFPLYSKTKICSRDADTVTLWTWLRSERSVQKRKIIWHVYMLSNPKIHFSLLMRPYWNVLELKGSSENSLCSCRDSTACIWISLPEIWFLGICLLVFFCFKKWDKCEFNIVAIAMQWKYRAEGKQRGLGIIMLYLFSKWVVFLWATTIVRYMGKET